MAIVVDEEQKREDTLRLLKILGVRLPPSTKLSLVDLEVRLSKALDCAQRQASIFGENRKIDPKELKKWDPSLFNLSSSMLSKSYEESITGEIDGSPFTALRMILSDSIAVYSQSTGDNRFFVEDGSTDRSILLKLTGIHVAAEGVAVFAVDFLPGTTSDDDEEGLKLLVNSDTYALFLGLLEHNAKRARSASSTLGWKASYLLPLGQISMKDVGSLTKDSGCNVCGEKATNKCASCHLVFYCGKDCQRSDWPSHKAMCQSLETGTWVDYKTGTKFPFTSIINRKDRPAKNDKDKKLAQKPCGNEPFIVKIQMNGAAGDPALVYDRKRTIQEYIDRDDNPRTFQRLADAVSKGYLGMKTYLWAKQSEPHVLSICLDRKAKQSEIDW